MKILTKEDLKNYNVTVINTDIYNMNLNVVLSNFPGALTTIEKDNDYKNPFMLLGQYKLIFTEGYVFAICFTRNGLKEQKVLLNLMVEKLYKFFRLEYKFQIYYNGEVREIRKDGEEFYTTRIESSNN